ncbi:MAG: DUF493 domain-containing protein [Pseudomonadales bacterium]|nr:DUF493 domain-containing protein [Pseudomonadales bacterium]
MDEPRIEFPCDYPIKVIVVAEPNILKEVVAVVEKYDARITADKVEQQPSKQGNYVSLRYDLWATGTAQLEKLFLDLKKIQAVRMVL